MAATDVKNDASLGDASLVSYWELEEGSGTRVDSHGTNDLTDNNTVLSAAAIQGDGADFELSNSEYLSITDASQIGLDITGDMSVAQFIKFESTGGQQILTGKWSGYLNNRSILFYFEANTLRLLVSNNGSTATLKTVAWTPTVGTFYQVGFSYDASAGSVAFYVNGAQQGTTQTGLPTAIYNSSAQFTIGTIRDATDTPTSFLDGVVDETGVWTKPLTTTDFSNHYNAGAGIPYDAGGATPATNNSARRLHMMMM